MNDLAFFHSYGILETGLNYYNNGFTELYCMATIGGDLFNNGESSGPPFGCGGYTVTGNAYNNGNFGNNALSLDLCKATGPGGFDGSLGTIGPNVTYCVCSNSCTQQSAGLENLALISTHRELIKIVDITGREIEFKPNTTLLYVYSDGTIEKIFQFEQRYRCIQ